MRVIHLTTPESVKAAAADLHPHAMAIGDFDGVHLGHQQVIQTAVQTAGRSGLRSSVMTFHPHPREVLGNSVYAKFLAPFEEKLKQFERLEIDHVFIVSFHADFAKLSPAQFVQQYIEELACEAVIVGFDFTFGSRGAGTVDTLRELAGQRLNVQVVPPFQLDGQKVSSTYIREQLHLGEIGEATRFLGRKYALQGKVVHGDGRGSSIGFPTANVELDSAFVLPKRGVYAVRVHLMETGTVQNGVMNIGRRPTFHDHQTEDSIEVHLFDYSGDLYGQGLRVEIMAYVRDERKFASVDELVEQIRMDAEQARQMLLTDRTLT
ncbi:bifunctional riboflavin kinase/FAD synthetase [Marinicrinis sediminis]|uniref:Riboflavin biosynthesis protein n=1 Tax=Marinicrinis sediminis TaxID=1652465 RepID=A0ABW5R5M7_9BACL